MFLPGCYSVRVCSWSDGSVPPPPTPTVHCAHNQILVCLAVVGFNSPKLPRLILGKEKPVHPGGQNKFKFRAV